MSHVVKMNIKINGRPNSVTIRKEFIALWLVMHGRDKDPDPASTLSDFIESAIIPKWMTRKNANNYAKGLSGYINQCLIRSFLEEDDFFLWRKVCNKL